VPPVPLLPPAPVVIAPAPGGWWGRTFGHITRMAGDVVHHFTDRLVLPMMPLPPPPPPDATLDPAPVQAGVILSGEALRELGSMATGLPRLFVSLSTESPLRQAFSRCVVAQQMVVMQGTNDTRLVSDRGVARLDSRLRLGLVHLYQKASLSSVLTPLSFVLGTSVLAPLLKDSVHPYVRMAVGAVQLIEAISMVYHGPMVHDIPINPTTTLTYSPTVVAGVLRELPFNASDRISAISSISLRFGGLNIPSECSTQCLSGSRNAAEAVVRTSQSADGLYFFGVPAASPPAALGSLHSEHGFLKFLLNIPVRHLLTHSSTPLTPLVLAALSINVCLLGLYPVLHPSVSTRTTLRLCAKVFISALRATCLTLIRRFSGVSLPLWIAGARFTLLQ